MRKLPPFLRRFLLRAALLCAVAWGGWFAWKAWLEPWLFPPSPLVLTPQLALEALDARKLYYNGAARQWLVAMRPELLAPDDRGEAGPTARAMTQATQNPKLFRQLDRQHRFDTLLLLGDPSGYQRLLAHLLEPPLEQRDFRLVYLDHWALVFKRGATREWQPADAAPQRERIAPLRSEDRAMFLAKAAAKMLSIQRIEPARLWLDEALAANGASLDALAGMAGYYVALGKWKEAESFADRALAADENCVPALSAKVIAMRATDHKIDALKYSAKLNGLLPEDPVRLWQHSRIAHEAQDYAAEVAALTRLVALAEEEGRSAGDYHFALGEAHVFMAMQDETHAAPAVKHLKTALADPLLPEEKRKFASERLAIIRERTGLK